MIVIILSIILGIVFLTIFIIYLIRKLKENKPTEQINLDNYFGPQNDNNQYQQNNFNPNNYPNNYPNNQFGQQGGQSNYNGQNQQWNNKNNK